MAYPNIYDVTYSYSGFQQAQGDNSFPGTQLDADLTGLEDSIDNLALFVRGVMRSDGVLNNELVTFDSLDQYLKTYIGRGAEGQPGPANPSDFATRMLVIGATIAASVTYLRIAGYAAAGDGGGALYKKVGSQPSHGAKIQSADGAWWELAEAKPTAEMFGASTAAADNMAALRIAAAYCNAKAITEVVANSSLVCTTYADADQALLADVTFAGNGRLTGVYRKQVIPAHAPSDALETMDLIPEIHLAVMNRAGASPKIVIAGDSTATYLANSLGRQALIVEAIKRKIADEFATPTFLDMSIGGRGYAGLHANTGVTNEWSTDPTKTWLSYYIKNAAPDVIVLDFGMNDSSSVSYTQIAMIFTEINTWPKIPDVVFCTNSVPSLAWPGSATKAEQEGRDMAAGMTRTFAQYNGKGLLDFHRKFCMARDGFDPLSSALRTGNTIAVSTNLCRGTTECWDFKANIHFSGASWAAGSTTDFLTIQTGTGSADFLQITKSAGGFFAFALLGGDLGDFVTAGTATTAASIPGAATSIVVEKFGNRLTVYLEDATFFGTYSEPIFSSRGISKGGRYLPRVDNAGNAGLISVDFSYGEPRYNKPSASNTALLGSVDGLGVPYGGFGGNHPTSVGFTHVYWPIVGQSRWAGLNTADPATFASYKATAAGSSAWALDASASTISVTNSGLIALAAGSGLVTITDTTTTGATAVYLLGANSTTMIKQTSGGPFVDGAVGGGQAGIIYSAGQYVISNKTGVTVAFGVSGMRSRPT